MNTARTVRSISKHYEKQLVESNKTYKLISSGSTLLNLALSGMSKGGFATGKVANIIGDSHSGKTLLSLTILAEMAKSSRFDDYLFIYDDVEAALEFDVAKIFGQKVKDRILPPQYDEDREPRSSDTIEEFQYNVMQLLKGDKPFIYILDSLDALDSDDDVKKMDENIIARQKGNKEKGSYNMSKPKKMSEMFRRIVRKLKKGNSLLIVVSQTRDNINPMSFQTKTRSGGRALEFYSSFIMWMAVAKKHKKHDRMVGIDCKIKVSKSKLTGKMREVTIPIYTNYGIDETGSCIDWLETEGHWKKKGNKIKALEFKVCMLREKLIQYIESSPEKQKKLRHIMADMWERIEKSLELNRKPRYE